MPFRNKQSQDHPSLNPKANSESNGGEKFSFQSGTRKTGNNGSFDTKNKSFVVSKSQREVKPAGQKKTVPEIAAENPVQTEPAVTAPNQYFSESKPEKRETKEKFTDKWLARRGHTVTYALLFAFTFVLYFRPYELIPGLESFSSIALYLALATLAVFLPSQLATEGSLTARPAEVNWVLLLTLFGVITIPIARSSSIAWEAFNDPFIKVVLMFIVMINVVRTKARLKGLIWLAMAVGVMLAFDVIKNYATGNFSVEGYRAMADIKGMFGNPNAQAMHFVSITPIAVALAFAARNFLTKFAYIALTILFIAGNIFTFSRGGFLGLIVVGLVLAWKIGRESRVKVMLASAVIGLIFIAIAPGNYGLRILSIFIPALDSVGSSDQRKDLLWTSIIVTLRNPWGIGMMNFPLANPRALVTHNSYTQVSAEMGVLALICYLMLIVTPFKRLLWIERELYEDGRRGWTYYLTIGLQASIAGFAVASFFDSAAYQWFLYYLVAYAVCLRRVYQLNPKVETGSRLRTS
ncbi:MAG: O-antigen ligase family protein [Acidobacteriota bacterium]|nr:O-antigen ligase family protein [Acidobacteriota bacterium]